jgi:hypothetical protein
VLRRFRTESNGKDDFIVRLGWNALRLTTPARKPFDLIGYLQCLPPDLSSHEVNLRTPLGHDEPALAPQLIVQRKTPEAAEATRLALHRSAAKKGKALDPRSLIAAEFMILATFLLKWRIQRKGNPGGLSPALADRIGVQASKVAVAY